MGVSPMSSTGVPPVAEQANAGNTAKMAVRLTGETPVLRPGSTIEFSRELR
jgi:hypothetical protein